MITDPKELKALAEWFDNFEDGCWPAPTHKVCQTAARHLRAYAEQIVGNAQRCPVCNGNGHVPAGFYMQTTGQWSGTSTATEKCRSCNGTGVLTTPTDQLTQRDARIKEFVTLCEWMNALGGMGNDVHNAIDKALHAK